MKVNKRIITIGGTVLCAAGIGFFMQSGTGPLPGSVSVETEVSRADFKPLSQPTVSGMVGSAGDADIEVAADDTVLEEADDVFVTAALDTPAAEVSEPTDEDVVETTEDNSADACAITSSAAPEAGAMVRVQISAPCLPDARVTMHHNGMMFDAITDAAGQLDQLVPALSETAVVIAEFENGEGTVAMTEVTSLAFYDRVVLQWEGQTGLQLHAREYGAAYGEDGHVWHAAAGDVEAAALGEGGFVTRLGGGWDAAPRVAEVYTFPTGTAVRSGLIDMTVEAEVTLATCGREIEAQALQLKSGDGVRSQYLTLAMPDCASVGDFLVLNNLVDDLKIAAN